MVKRIAKPLSKPRGSTAHALKKVAERDETIEDLHIIISNLNANAELSRRAHGKEISNADFAGYVRGLREGARNAERLADEFAAKARKDGIPLDDEIAHHAAAVGARNVGFALRRRASNVARAKSAMGVDVRAVSVGDSDMIFKHIQETGQWQKVPKSE